MNGRGSKQKGDRLELTIARAMSIWVDPANEKYKTARAEDLPFRRTPNSGGWTKSRKAYIGDIMAPEGFPFVFEAKNRESWTWDQRFRDNPGWEPEKWWIEDTVRLAVPSCRIPVLIFKKNHAQPFVRVSRRTWFRFLREVWPKLKPFCIMQDAVYFRLSDFLAQPYDAVRRAFADKVKTVKDVRDLL